MLALLLPSLIFTTPPPSPTQYATEVDNVGLVGGKGDVKLLAYDDGGNIITTLTLSADADDGSVSLLCEYDDGFATFTIATDNAVFDDDSTLSRELVAQRADALLAVLEEYSEPLGSKLSCAMSIAESLSSCAAGYSDCADTALETACDCLPQVAAQWTGETCPESD